MEARVVSAGERGDFVIFLPDEFPDSMWMNSLTLRRKQKIHTTHAQPAAFVEIFNTRSRTHPPRSTAVQIAAIRKASEAHLKGFLAEHVGVQEEPPRLIVYGEDYSQYGKSGDVSCHVHRGTHGTHGHTDHTDENLTSDPSQPSHPQTHTRTNARQLLGRYPDTLF